MAEREFREFAVLRNLGIFDVFRIREPGELLHFSDYLPLAVLA